MEILYKNNILEIEDLKVLGANNEGVVYQYKNNAIKIYHKHPKKFILTKDVCEQFTKIKTQQILMPNDLVYSKDKEYIGSATLYVDKKISPSSMWETLSNNLDQEQQVLDEDLKKEEIIDVHPNVNTSTVFISYNDLIKFINSFGNEIFYVNI